MLTGKVRNVTLGNPVDRMLPTCVPTHTGLPTLGAHLPLTARVLSRCRPAQHVRSSKHGTGEDTPWSGRVASVGPLAASSRPRTHLAQSGTGNFPTASRGAGSWDPGSAETNLKAGFLGKPPGQALRACGDLQGCQASLQGAQDNTGNG